MFSCSGKFLDISYPMVKACFPLTAKVVLEQFSRLSTCSVECHHVIWGYSLFLTGSGKKNPFILYWLIYNTAFPDGKAKWTNWFAIWVTSSIWRTLKKNQNHLVMLSWYLLKQMGFLVQGLFATSIWLGNKFSQGSQILSVSFYFAL